MIQEITSKEPIAEIKELNRDIILISKWVRIYFGGEFIADSKNVILLRQKGLSPVYYFPQQDIRMEYLQSKGRTGKFPALGKVNLLTVRVGNRIAENAAWKVVEPPPDLILLEGYIAFKWAEMDSWFEEDEEVFVHPRDPHVRIDAIQSSRNIRVEFNGEIIAETNRPVLLFETGAPVRYYIPKADVRLDLLETSEMHTGCPYKGIASYYSINVSGKIIKDSIWYYPFPYPEVVKIQNLVSFYPSKVDAIYVDGIKQA
jgi:uncharacterized protein (DUF427 family)